jgi:hypothetical protein
MDKQKMKLSLTHLAVEGKVVALNCESSLQRDSFPFTVMRESKR